MRMVKSLKISFFMIALMLALPLSAWGWPTAGDWIAVPRGFSFLSDPQSDAIGNDARDIVGDATYPVAYVFNDGNYVHYRMRVDKDPRMDPVTGALRPFGWGFLIDTDNSSDDYEYMVMIDGIANPEVMYLAKNTVQGTLGDASDKAELIQWQENLNYGANYRIVSAGSIFPVASPTEDFFIDWKIPFDVFKSSLGIGDDTLIRYFVGSANNAMVLNADLCEGSGQTSLSLGLSDFVLPNGQEPDTGSATFVTALDGSGDLTEFYAGSTIFIRVDDNDRNGIASQSETITLTVSAASGDNLTLTLTETGTDSGIFTAPLPTSDGTPIAGDGTLQVSPIEIITASYVDSTDASYFVDQIRTDTARALPAADLAVSKSVDDSTPNEGETVTYTVAIFNNGPSAASGIQITDQLPAGVTCSGDDSGGSYNPATGLWTAGSLAKGESRSLQISATVDAGTVNTTITNTAALTAASQPDPNSANDAASANIAVTGVDLSVNKTVNDATPPTGGMVTFTLTVSNPGGDTATGVALSDLLPPATWTNISVVSISQGAYAIGSGLWDVGSLGAATTATLQISAELQSTVTAGTVVANTASISSSDQADPDPSNNSESVELVVGGVDLSLSQIVSNAAPDEGEAITFTVTVGNSPTAAATADGVVIGDVLPAGLTYSSHSASGATSYDSITGDWSGIALAPGASATLTITATVDSGMAGNTLINTATLTAVNQTDIDSGNDTTEAGVTVRHTDLMVTKTATNTTPGDKTNIDFIITVKNLGPLDAADVTVFDQLPGQAGYVSHLAPAGTSYSTATHLWTVGDLPVGAELTLTITAYVNIGNNPKTFFNSAYLNSCTPGDNNGTNDVSSVTITVDGTDLGITKTMETGYTNYPASGDSTVFLITLTNDGPNQATGVVVKDLIPAGLSCDSAVVSQGSFTNNGAKCDWSAGSLNAGASATMRLSSTVSAANGSTLTNRASITAADQADGNAGNNTASQVLYIGASDLALSKVADNSAPNEGETVTFTVTLTNNGTNAVNGIAVTDLLPAGLTLLTAAPDAPLPSQGSYDDATGVWTVGALPYPGSATLILKAAVDAGTGGAIITNSADITAADSFDPLPGNNVATADITVQQADIFVNQSASTLTPYTGDTVTFTIVAGNNGPHGATGVLVRDVLPSGLTYLSHTASAGTSYDPSSGDWSVGALAKAVPFTLTVVATVDPGSAGATLLNTAGKISADQSDPNSSNDSATISISPQTLTIDLRLTKTVDKATPVEGSNVVFTLTLYNLHGSRGATGIQVADPLPAGFTFVSATPSQGTYDSGAGLWDIGSLGPMSNVTMTITAKTSCGSSGSTLTNSAAISAADQSDPDAANDSASVDVAPTDASPSLMVVKSASAPAVSPGDVVTYTVQVQNTGCGKATNVELDDHMSPYTAWQLDYNSDGSPDEPFSFAAQTSELALGIPDYSRDDGSTWGATPTSEGGGMPVGYDGTITNWQIPMVGNMVPGGQFTLRYKVRVK
jgi:uncharacterized repeat protein (TIGR01451 family)